MYQTPKAAYSAVCHHEAHLIQWVTDWMIDTGSLTPPIVRPFFLALGSTTSPVPIVDTRLSICVLWSWSDWQPTSTHPSIHSPPHPPPSSCHHSASLIEFFQYIPRGSMRRVTCFWLPHHTPGIKDFLYQAGELSRWNKVCVCVCVCVCV